MRFKTFLLTAIAFCLLASGAQAQESLTLRKIRETGIVSIGYRDGSIPFSYLDKKQRPIGYSMDICFRIVDALKATLKMPGLEVQLRPITSANRIPFVVNDIVDLECGTTTNNVDRQKRVDFTVTTFVALSSLVSKKSSHIRNVEDLKGESVVSTAGTTHIKAIAELNRARRLDMNILAGRDHIESFEMVAADRALAFVMDDVLLYGLVASAKNPGEFMIHNSGLSVEPYGIALRKNDREFKKIADEAIVGLFKSGEINQIYEKWFQSPIPPNQINLKLPMSAALKKVIAQPTDSSDQADYR